MALRGFLGFQMGDAVIPNTRGRGNAPGGTV
jgi:hypothetical protein